MLPEKWFIARTKENWQIVIDWLNKEINQGTSYESSCEGIYYPNFDDFKGFKNGAHSGSKLSKWPYRDYTEITFEEFTKYVLNKKTPLKENYKYLIPLFKKLKIK